MISQMKRWILVIIDHSTRFMTATWVTSTTSIETWQVFMRSWVQHFGSPKYVLTDGGSAFGKDFHQRVTHWLGSQHRVTAPFHPQSNGINEASHKSLKAVVNAMVQDGFTNPDLMVQVAVEVHNSTPHWVLKVSPTRPSSEDNHITDTYKN